MFYSQFILAKKGPLGTIWIAAHLERKLRKNQVADTDIGVSVDSILFPEVPIALRLSSHLLLGVVRIYSRKVNYLFDDCSEALLKVKQAFRSTAVDLPPEESTAPYHSITLPETFDLDDFELPDNDIFQGNYVDRHVSTREQITLQDTLDGMAYKTTQFGLDERFGDGDASQIGLDLDEVMLIDKDSTLEHNDFSANPQVSRQEDEKKEDVVTTSDKMLVEDSGSKVMLIDQDANLEPDDLGANSQISHHKDEKKEDVIGTSNRMQVEDSGSKIDLSDGFPTSPEFHEYAQGLSTSPEFHDYAQDPSTSPEFHNCAQDPSVSPEFHEYAQGPSTPGLQEPNLFGTQSDQVINEADFHNSADLLSMYSTQNESRAHQTENNVIGCSLQNNGKHVGVDLHHEASDCVLADVNNKREEQEHFTRTVVMKDQGNLIPNNNCLASVPLMDSSNEDHTTTVLPECAGGYVDTSGILEKVERLHDGVLMNTESVMANLNETVNVVSGGVNINDSGVSPSCSHVTSDQEGLSCKLLSNMDESRGSEFGGHLADVTTLLKHGVSNNSEVSKNEQQPSVAYEAQVSNIVSPLESSGRPEVVDVEARASQELKEAGILNFVSHEAEQPTQSHLRPCTSRVNNPSLLSIEGEKCHETDVSDPALGYHGTVEPSACEGKLDLGQSGMQFGSQIISNKMGSVNTFTASDIPEPESMLSLGQSGMQFGSQIISNKMGSVNTFTASDIPEPEKMLSLGQSGMQFGNQMISNKMGSVNTFTATDIPEPEKMLSLGQSGMQIGNQMISNKMGSVNTFTATDIPEPEKMLSLGQSGMQFGNQMISNKMGSVNAFTASDIPAPEKMLSLGQSDMQYGSQMIGNKMGSVNTFTASNIPEPEKMLSLAYPHFGEMNHLLLESTPGNQVISGGHRDVAAVTSISGQKRSYTESTLTLQSMGLVESYGGAQSRRTTGSIPDDNDLLSSILAGRKSSALKVKPSPATAEVPTAKRFRSTPRTSTLKRKVLVDDTMVLHGDTIRHQLISTEDIRRVRKKAPCTSDEILMIQRQVLEDKIFHKPIFTDLSADLTILQNGAFDLSGIKVYDYGLDGFSVEKVNNQQSYSKSNAEIHVGQAHNEPMAVQPQEEAEESYSKTNVGIHEVESHNEPMEVQLQNNAEAQPSEMPVPSERESHNETMEVQPQITAEAQPSEMPVPSEREPHNETMEVQPQITAEARPSEMPVPSERESHNETMEVQPQITAEAQPSEMPVPSERESHNETMEVQPQITAEAQPSEIPLQLESDQSGVDFGSHDIDAHGRANIISNMKELSGSQNAEMNNAGGIFEISETENYSVGPTNIISDVNELGSSQNAEMNNAGRIFETSEAENYSIVHSNIISDVNELGGSQNAEMNNAGRNFETSEAENYSIVHSNIISDGNELGSSQNAEMSNSGGNFETFESENYSVVPGHETLSLTEVFENELCMPKDFDASQPLMDKTDDGAGSIQTNVLEIPTSEKMNTSTILENEFVDDQHDRNNADAIEIAEHDMEIGTRVETDGLEADNLHASLVLGSKEASEYTDNQVSFHGDLPMEENGNNMLEGLNEDLVVSSGLGCDDKDAKAGGLFSENIEVDCLHSVAPEDVKEGSNDEENSVFQEAALQNTMYPDVSAIRSPSVDQNDEDDMVDNDTGFLNVGDDEIIDDDDDDADGFAPGAEGTQLENSGWSSRTRAVAKYLQTLFDKEDLHGRQSLHLDKILVGKTRKEASRMFFETLVLKTRDYIDVEQTKPFANINLQPRGKLMKTDF
ncbi:sister chromatid cohesion 1 protein 4 isoform X26 [Lathyrus oleraceus]|uniref:sister chromatid cohesion 1 protein 4 isoform X26 n=1 Tax=Pisum sativum TaxID=3888 RepID=UPI0021CE99C6|nr:sister chromatid cohesion 1 protein 4 isoform X26 [Pisum sativum]